MSSRNRAFTLIELLVVVAIIALLISILLPSLQGAREQGKRATCLSNIRSIAQGSSAYSSEQKREHAIPIQQQMVSDQLGTGFNGSNYWSLRTALPFAYGGRTAQVIFPTDGGNVQVMTKENGRWAARTKPLNRYLYGASGIATQDSKNMPLYRCPSDVGYPQSIYVYDAPTSACAGIPCYDMIGNSYRFNFAGQFFPGGQSSRGEMSVGPYGHRISTLPNPARQTMYMEPLFYSMTIQAAVNGLPAEVLLRGWHKALMTDNVGFADGSARSTRVMDLDDWDATTLRKMNVNSTVMNDPHSFLRRGRTWQMDCYPTPGAYIPKFDSAGNQLIPDAQIASQYGPGWPAQGFQKNMAPPGEE